MAGSRFHEDGYPDLELFYKGRAKWRRGDFKIEAGRGSEDYPPENRRVWIVFFLKYIKPCHLQAKVVKLWEYPG